MPALPPLIVVDDLVEYGYDPAYEAKIAQASARVRAYTKQRITLGASTVKLYGTGPWLLPQRPALSITTILDAGGVALTSGQYELRGQYLHVNARCPITVTFSHGFAVLPDELIEAVCAITARLATMPKSAAMGARAEQAGGEMVTWGVEAFNAASELTAAEKKAIEKTYPCRPRTAILI